MKLGSRILGSPLATALIVGVCMACGSTDGGDPADGEPEGPIEGASCGDGRIIDDGECVLDPFRYEPDERLDFDNVLYFGDEPLTLLTDLPDPPKSGFRLVMVPQEVPPGFDSETGAGDGYADVSPCQAWPMPDVGNNWVYTASLHTTPGLHHANMYGMAVDPDQGAQPYPNCRASADSMVFGQIPRALSGDVENTFVPAVLFANSTQVIGVNAEQYALAEGYAYELPAGIEIATDTHLQNTTPDSLHVEAAWDFYTMPVEAVTNPASMFVYIHFGFLIPPRSEKIVHGNCGWGGGDVLAIMPHTHQWATRFVTNFGTAPLIDNAPDIALDSFITDVTAYDRDGIGLIDSDVQVYDPALETTGMDSVQFQCHFNNTTDHEMRFGVGENEMCFLFGYQSPVEAQRIGLMTSEDGACVTLDPNIVRQ